MLLNYNIVWIGGHGPNGMKGGGANKKRGQYIFSDQFGFISSSTWRPNLKGEGVVQPKPYA
jgi:hypothetical protein